MKTRTIAAALAAMAVFSLEANTLRVVSKAADKTGDWASAYLSIADAISAASANDTILVASGKYEIGSTLVVDKAGLTIRSASLSTGEEDPEGTILDGGDDPDGGTDGVRIMLVKAKNVNVAGFTFTHAYYSPASGSDGGAAIKMESGNVSQYFSVSNCTFTANRSTGNGTCIFSYTNKDGTIADCVFTNNLTSSTTSGGVGGCAIYTQQNSEDVTDRIKVRNCVFGRNSIFCGKALGATVRADRGILLDGCTFLGGDTVTRNGTTTSGHEGTVQVGATAEIRDCTFTGNVPPGFDGYGTYLNFRGSGNIVVSNCSFSAIAEDKGGYGMLCLSASNVRFYDCRFTDITTKSHFLFMNGRKGLMFRNCLFSGITIGNSASLLHNYSPVVGDGYTFENCTVANVTAAKTLSSSSSANACTNRLVNSILPGSVEASADARVMIASNCCLTALLGGQFDSGNITPASPGLKRNCRLLSTSPCVDAGTRLDWMDAFSTDLSGFPRIVGAAVDIGCFERQAGEMDSTLLVVANEADKTGVWSEASTDVQGVIDLAEDGDIVLVRSGTYALESQIVISNKTVTFRSCNPATGETDREGTIFDGTLCDGRAMVVSTGPESNVSNYGPVPTANHPIVVEGFTFRNFSSDDNGGAVWFGGMGGSGGVPATLSNCAFSGNRSAGMGGAVFVNRGGKIDGCVFTGNSSGAKGGAVCVWNNTAYTFNVQTWPGIDISTRGWYLPQVVSCSFTGNSSVNIGGALSSEFNIYIKGCTFNGNSATMASGGTKQGACLRVQWGARIHDCVFSGNYFDQYAGGGYGSALFVRSSSIVSNCVITGSGEAYGAVYLDSDYAIATVVDCVSTNNSSDGFWMNCGNLRQCVSAKNTAGVRMHQKGNNPLYVDNCTIVGNSSGINISDSTNEVVLSNSILCGNKNTFSLKKTDGSQTCVLSNSLVDVSKPAADYITFTNVRKVSDMRFADEAAGDYHLTARSPACEFGTMLSWMTAADVDMDGNPRIVSRAGLPLASDAAALPDAGCYEFQSAHPLPGLSIVIE